MHRVLSIPIADISVPEDRARELDQAWVEGLAGIIDAEGLIQPIVVKIAGEHLGGGSKEDRSIYRLIAGAHRLAACQALGWESITAVIYPEDFGDSHLIETLENLARRELNALDRAKSFARFKAGYEAKHGPIARGGDRKSKAAKDQSADIALWSFHEAIAERTGFSRRTVFVYLAVWQGLNHDQYKRLCALPTLADNLGQLKLLSEQNHDLQDQVLGLIEGGKAGTVTDALTLIARGRLDTKQEKAMTAARSAWSRLSRDDRHRLFEQYEDDIRAFAKERGWI